MAVEQHKLTPVLIGIHLVALPMYARLPPAVWLLMAAFTLWSLLIITGRTRQPLALIRFLLTIAVLVALVISYGTIFGQEPGIAMLLMLSFLKLFEMKGRRDVLLVIFLGYFLMATHFFHSQSPWLAAYALLVVVYLTSLLIVFSDRLSSTSFKTRIKIAVRMLLQATPLMLILFVLFPRIPGPLWGLPDDAKSAMTGVGDKMSPGSINQLISSGAVAFRVQFDSQPPAQRDLYWRGVVLTQYDGVSWTREQAPENGQPEVNDEAAGVNGFEYTVMLEPHGRNWLYSLETLIAKEDAYSVTRDLQVVTKKAITSTLAYTMTSKLNVANRILSDREKEKNLSLPPGLNQQTVLLARALRREAGSNTAFVEAVLQYFAGQNFTYTLSPQLLGEHAMDDFIFNSQQGFCEHYSSAFVYLMRAAGVPARVVVGYQGGTFNPLDNYMIIRQSDAHAWTEIWLEARGWVRIDPTSVVAPARIEHGISNAGLEAGRLPLILVSDNELFLKLRYSLDSFSHNWNKWVISFNEKRQQELFKRLGVDDIDKATLFSWMVMAMTLFGALVALWVFKHGAGKSRRDVALYYYDRFCQKLEKVGLVKQPSESSDEFLRRVVQRFPELEQSANFITRSYQRIRYSAEHDGNDKEQFIRAVQQFRVR